MGLAYRRYTVNVEKNSLSHTCVQCPSTCTEEDFMFAKENAANMA